MSNPVALDQLVPKNLTKFFVESPRLFRTSKNIQILVLRQTQDFTIFRTEETRELNLVTLPKSALDKTPTVKVVMLASKQKAPENRLYHNLLRTAAEEVGYKLDDDLRQCELKDNLCQKCPRCILFGSVSVEKGGQERWNIKHRIEYSSAYSVEPYEEIYEILTFNAVDSVTQSTGQALGYTENIQPLTTLPSIVTLNSVTLEEFIAYLKTLMACKSYGAETRVKGDMVNHIVGIVGSYDEIITPLEYNLELSAVKLGEVDPLEKTADILEKYKKFSAFSNDVVLLSRKELSSFIERVAKFQYSKPFIEKIYQDAVSLGKNLSEYGPKPKAKRKP
jgi:CRISPR-associated protein Csc2